MFTGIITDIGKILSVQDHGSALRKIRIRTAWHPDTIVIGASIACSGPCLTVTAHGLFPGDGDPAGWFEVDAAAETLQRTTAGSWETGDRLNLERALKIGDELGGHLVTGHIDATADVIGRETVSGGDTRQDETVRFHVRAPEHLAPFIAEKGSVALDGVSLTVNSVTADGVFDVLLIPHTLKATTWGERRAGDRVNLEVDLMARYAARLSHKNLPS
ncbi:MAG: riboflavin synthase [Methylobacteriaceae bacterium]|jgi:riboflavin synthase|nr:riboflavin synthase [Methylobacteriaceae bacterium]